MARPAVNVPSPTTTAPPPVSERAIVGLVGAIQFVNILDFMMVMPLGPDFARGLDIPESRLGLVAGMYTLAAGISGVLGATFLDRFDRRAALAVAMAGLVVGTVLCGFATGLGTMLLARAVAGAFGGPATALALSIVSDVVPQERLGRAMGSVMGAFSVASVLGVPAGLWLGELVGDWRTPFFAVAGLGAVLVAASLFIMPPMRRHLDQPLGPSVTPREIVARPIVRQALWMMGVGFMASFTIIPNISAYVQNNAGYPREALERLYFAGGIASFFALRQAGGLVDRVGVLRMTALGTAVLTVIIGLGFGFDVPQIPVMAIFIGFMLGMAIRNVTLNTLSLKVPRPAERARYQSLQSATQHFASALGAGISSLLLTTRPDGRLDGMWRVTALCVALSWLVPWLAWRVEGSVRSTD